MIVGLRFYNNAESIESIAETEAEKALPGFVAESKGRRWRVSSGFSYRPAGVERVVLEREAESMGQLEQR